MHHSGFSSNKYIGFLSFNLFTNGNNILSFLPNFNSDFGQVSKEDSKYFDMKLDELSAISDKTEESILSLIELGNGFLS